MKKKKRQIKGDKNSNNKLSFWGPLEVWISSENNNYSECVWKLPYFFALLKGICYLTLLMRFNINESYALF